jgi:hypothetical protein
MRRAMSAPNEHEDVSEGHALALVSQTATQEDAEDEEEQQLPINVKTVFEMSRYL